MRRRGSGERSRDHGGFVSGGDGGLVGRREQLHAVVGPHLPRPRRALRRRCSRSPSKPYPPARFHPRPAWLEKMTLIGL